MIKMQELTMQEVGNVSGGFVPPSHVYPGMNARIALRTFPGLGYVASAFTVGYQAGNWLNRNTPIQSWIRSWY